MEYTVLKLNEDVSGIANGTIISKRNRIANYTIIK